MRKHIIIAALLATVSTTPALAQDGRGRGGDGQAQRGGGDRGGDRGGGDRGSFRGGNRGGEGRPQTAPAPQQQADPQQVRRPQAVQGQRPGGTPNWQGRGPQGMIQGQQVQGQSGQWQGRIQGQQQRTQGQWTQEQWNGRGRGDRPGPAQIQQQQRGDAIRNWQGNRNNPNWQGNRGGNDARFQNRDRNGDGFRGNNSGRDPRFGFTRSGGRDGNWRDNGGRGQSWNRDWRRDQRYNWQSYRSANRNFYRLPRYQSPYGYGYGYGYQRFGIGVYLDSLLFSQDYWIDNPYEYRLPEAYPPYHWVRYYNDALLVDEETGYVVDTIYDIFD